jgi:hypothetical protein
VHGAGWPRLLPLDSRTNLGALKRGQMLGELERLFLNMVWHRHNLLIARHLCWCRGFTAQRGRPGTLRVPCDAGLARLTCTRE